MKGKSENGSSSPSNEMDRREFMVRAAVIGAGLARTPELLRTTHGAQRVAGVSSSAGKAHHLSRAGELTLGNDHIAAAWTVGDGTLRAIRVEDHLGQHPMALSPDVFTLRLADGGGVLRSSGMRVVGEPRAERLAGNPAASRASERVPGRQVVVELEDRDGRLRATWRGVLRDGSSYVRQELELRATGTDLPVREIGLLDAVASGATLSGIVAGSPVVAGNLFFGAEHPLSESRVVGDRARCYLSRELPLRAGAPVSLSSVIGTTPAGQLRRGFLAYLERERAHPYRPFLHYNSWYDIGYFSRYDEASALDVIRAFGEELHVKRGVTLSSFLFDDGWDDPENLWRFNSGFPRGFTPIREAAARCGAAPGVWLSPWGGYGKPRQQRLALGKAQGFETNDEGFALSGPKYYARFHEACVDMIRKYGINQFKIDGTGDAARAIPGSTFDSDFDAAIHLIADLRAEQPALFVNLTTGTYPSPFWLRHADSIWRGGDDHSFAGVGSHRQQWITYRDADTYAGIVARNALFPLNSLMLHGLIYARSARHLDTDPRGDFRSEVRSYFGTGTQLQEMYITHSLLGDRDWNDIAEAAMWSRRNAATLVDTHWVGGDPGGVEPYGWASWSPGKGILVLRNPADAPQSIEIDVARALELPSTAAEEHRASSPWREDRGRAPIALRAGTPHRFSLAPFEVVTLEVTPR
ncbi:MAG TPA: hypothetical protein VFS44_12515 [Gemmatimonadaceae bacterium]|nr:hypothetical protein [Gemmatimonadaceae bacterium]